MTEANNNKRPNGYTDPSENVKALSEAANKRQDDLRELSDQLSDAKASHVAEVANLRAGYQESIGRLREEYQEKIARAESGRLDSIRQVDREEVAKTAVVANTAITTLAKQTTDLATTLQKQVADTATAAEARNTATYTDVNKRLSALELSSSEGKGKQTLADPQMDKLVAAVGALDLAARQNVGKNEGISTSWAVFLGIATLLVVAAGALGFTFSSRTPTAPLQPQVIYVPSPAVAPSTPPATLSQTPR